MTVYCIVSSIKGEPAEPRSVGGQVAWTERSEAEEAMERYCRWYGHERADFAVRQFHLSEMP